MSTFPSIRIEGGILAPDLLDQLLAAELPGQRPADFGADAARSLTDTIAQAFEDARRLWDVFQRRLSRLTDNDPATSQTRDLWVNPFLSILGYEIRYNRSAYDVDGRGYAISHRAGEAEDAPPVHIVGARQELGRLDRVGRTHLAPHSLVQEFLNRTEHLWGIVTNGLTLRLLRDSTYIRRQAYVEFDLAAMLEEQRFQDFAALYRLLHRTRLPRGVGDAHECLLEQYYQHSVEQGGRVRERLRDGVEECLKRLANGFLRHSANGELRSRVTSTPGQGGSPPLTPEELYRQLLRLVYRFLFLLVSEDRGLISDDPIYLEHYGVARLRRLVDTRAAYTDHDDLWCSLRVLWKVLSDEKFAAYLHAAPLNGELFAEIYLDHCSISNRHLLEAFWHLVYYSETPSAPPRRVNYAALDVEELGSVYESLLELQPVIEANGEWGAGSWERGVANGVRFDFIQGGERKSTGSYYTPPELVAELVRSALDPVIRERLQEARRMASGERTANGERGAGRGERRQPSAVRGSPYLTEEEKRHVYRVLSRSGRLEQLHGARSSAVPAHEKLSQGGAFRDDVSDPPGRGISSGEYRGRMGTGHNRGVHPVPSRGSGQSEGVGNTSPAERESGPFDPGTDPTTARPVPGDRAATAESSPQPYSEAAFLSLWHSTPLPTRYSLLAEHALLSIRVCDPAAGSGHFLLAAARRLGKELARVRTGEEEPAPESVREAIRDVVAHCIYGVDKNPLAVELCRVALWLEAHTPGKPLTFLDHRIKCGDSLVGVFDLGVLRQGIPDEAFTPLAGDDKAIASALKRRNREERRGQRSLPFDQGNDPLAGLAADARALDAIPDDTPAAVRRKKEHYDSIRRSQFAIRQVCDLWTAAFFQRMANEGRWMEKALTTRVVWDHLEGRAHPQAAAEAQLLAVQQRFFHWALEFPEVFAAEGEQGPASRERRHISNLLVSAPNSPLPIRRSPGFDVVIGNPPFMGGLKISGSFGPHYRNWLEVVFPPYGGTADLCAAFFRRAFGLLRRGGRLGMVATNTICQGDTRQSGLAVIARAGGSITFARRFVKWPGAANVEVNLIAIHKPDHSPPTARPLPVLDGQPVCFISSRLDAEPEAEPRRLMQNDGKAFIGDFVRGIGFVIDPEEAEALLMEDPRNADCLFPYLNGEDLNSHPEQKPSRWVICFHDWDLERAEQYPELLRIVVQRVKPERDRLRGPGDRRNREYWWQFGAYRAGMRAAIAPLQRVLVRAQTGERHSVTFVGKSSIFSHTIVAFAFEDGYHFALIQSGVHEEWVRRYGVTLRTDLRYTPTDCFDTFPFPAEEYRRTANGQWRVEDMPAPFAMAAQIGAEYHEHRRNIMLARNLGLTKTYNLFHDPNCSDADIQRLHDLHAAMDHAILACYGWEDLSPRHGFYQNERGQTRFTMSPDVRREVLARLLELNANLAQQETKGVSR